MKNAQSQIKLTPLAQNLQRLCLIRTFVFSVLLVLVAGSYWYWHYPLNYTVLFATIAIAAFFTVLSFVRLRIFWPITDIELFIQLILDITLISVLIYYSGGASNPFVSYYLVPLTISAATLPWRYTWFIAIISLCCYTLMLFHYMPLDVLAPHHHTSDFNPHLIGMWFTFTVSALLITYFVVKMARSLRAREKALNAAHENNMRNEQIIGIATLAAGTAHKLGTPLSTMAVLLTEIKKRFQNDKEVLDNIGLLKNQLAICKNTLQELSQTAEIHTGENTKKSLAANICIRNLIDEWRIIRPDAIFSCDIPDDGNVPNIYIDTCLEHAIQNLLNNAADTDSRSIEISLDWNEHEIVLKIRDFGPGISLATAEHIGKPFFSTKKKGLGLGLFLSHATVNRYGGSLSLYNHEQGGTLTELTLPTART